MNAHTYLARKDFWDQIGLDHSWLIIAVTIVLSLSDHVAEAHPDWSGGTFLGMAVASSLFFFIFIFVHELSHAGVARSNDLPVRSIMFFALGGVAKRNNLLMAGRSFGWGSSGRLRAL